MTALWQCLARVFFTLRGGSTGPGLLAAAGRTPAAAGRTPAAAGPAGRTLTVAAGRTLTVAAGRILAVGAGSSLTTAEGAGVILGASRGSLAGGGSGLFSSLKGHLDAIDPWTGKSSGTVRVRARTRLRICYYLRAGKMCNGTKTRRFSNFVRLRTSSSKTLRFHPISIVIFENEPISPGILHSNSIDDDCFVFLYFGTNEHRFALEPSTGGCAR